MPKLSIHFTRAAEAGDGDDERRIDDDKADGERRRTICDELRASAMARP